MLQILKSVVSCFQSNQKATPPAPRRATLRLMCLEERQLLSASPLMAIAAPLHSNVAVVQPQTHNGLMNISSVINRPIQIQQVASFTNDSFNMVGENGTTHHLTINTQVNHFDGAAVITGMWDGSQAMTGVLHVNGATTSISFTWGPYGVPHRFDGVLSGSPGSYHIDGTVYVNGVKGGPGHTVGDEAPAIPHMVNAYYNLTSLSNGTKHTFQILTETDQYNGTATFTGTWDGGSAVTGTMHYDAQGNISISFTWGTNGVAHDFEGTISYNAYTIGTHISGLVTVNGNPNSGPGYVTGSQYLPIVNHS